MRSTLFLERLSTMMMMMMMTMIIIIIIISRPSFISYTLDWDKG